MGVDNIFILFFKIMKWNLLSSVKRKGGLGSILGQIGKKPKISTLVRQQSNIISSLLLALIMFAIFRDILLFLLLEIYFKLLGLSVVSGCFTTDHFAHASSSFSTDLRPQNHHTFAHGLLNLIICVKITFKYIFGRKLMSLKVIYAEWPHQILQLSRKLP